MLNKNRYHNHNIINFCLEHRNNIVSVIYYLYSTCNTNYVVYNILDNTLIINACNIEKNVSEII